MRLLVIGGGQFFGAAFVDAALAAGHEVAAVQRGVTSRSAPDGLEVLAGDRRTDLPLLLGEREFDAVVDTCGYMPDVVQAATDLLHDRVGRSCFISSVSAYDPDSGVEVIEDITPLDERSPSNNEYEPVDYGLRKVQCERVVFSAFGDRALIVRPGLIVGPNDHTERFAYWPRRFAEGGMILMARGPEYPFQVIDARDLADFVLRLVLDGRGGAVNAVGPRQTFADLITACNPTADVVYADDDWLLEREVIPFVGLPLWLPPGINLLASQERAVGWGLRTRPLAETAADTLTWDRERGLPPMPVAITLKREAELVAQLVAT